VINGIGWIDFSPDARRRVEDVLALLAEKGTLDELGVGQVRDAFSDRLFPGFSTIQTSVKYFIMIPRIFRDWDELARSRQARSTFEAYLRDSENLLARKLSTNHEKTNLSPERIIGHTLIDKGGVVRRPSSVYWNGLRVFGLVRTDQSLGEFSEAWNMPLEPATNVNSDEGEDDFVHRPGIIRIPSGHVAGWMDKVTLRLSGKEARFLLTRIELSDPDRETATAQLVHQGLIADVFALPTFAAFENWASRSTLSATCRAVITQAQQFSLAVEGAHIRLNRLVADRIGSQKLKVASESAYSEWVSRSARRNVFRPNAAAEWLMSSGIGAKVKRSTRLFLERWNDAILHRATERELDILIRKQAIENKPERSVLLKPPKKEPEWFGMRSLDFRWRNVRSMLEELHTGAGDAHSV
jgi:hypothetical protein